jgi:hypothetical protein
MYPFATAVGPRREPGPYCFRRHDKLQIVARGADMEIRQRH